MVSKYSFEKIMDVIRNHNYTTMVEVAKHFEVSKQLISSSIGKMEKDEVKKIEEQFKEQKKQLIAKKLDIPSIEGEVWVDYCIDEYDGTPAVRQIIQVSNKGRLAVTKTKEIKTTKEKNGFFVVPYKKLISIQESKTGTPMFAINGKTRSALKVVCLSFDVPNYRDGKLKFKPVDGNSLNLELSNISFVKKDY